MKLLLVMPDAHMHKLRLGPYVRSSREMPLTLATLAALTPPDPDIDIKLVDGSVDDIPLDYPADLVGISAITGCANGAYALADHYRARKVPVVLGGVHVTILPGEAMRHADAIVIGRGETAWPRLVNDFRRGEMKKVYQEDPIVGDVLLGVPSPRRELHHRLRYMIPDSVQATRGCQRACDFCTVPAVWNSYLKRPVGDVLRDVKAARGRTIAFNDVSLADDPEYAKELFKGMIPLKKNWGGLTTVDVVKDPELMSLMAQSGCKYLLLGFESENPAVLSTIHKGFNAPVSYGEVMKTMHGHGISIQGCFVFGFDADDKTIFESTVERVNELRVDIPRYSIYTPFPGTFLFNRLLAEKRILSFNWDDYDTMHVVHQPAQMTPEELYAGFKWAYRETFKLGSILKRVRGFGLNTAVNFVGNLTYKIFVKRLYHEPRFSFPYRLTAPGQPPDPGDFAVPFCRKLSPCPD